MRTIRAWDIKPRILDKKPTYLLTMSDLKPDAAKRCDGIPVVFYEGLPGQRLLRCDEQFAGATLIEAA